METTNNKNLATFTHLSALSQYCIPFGNFIFPILIWSTNKDKSAFIDFNGKQVLNFQLSIFLYTLVLALVAIPILIGTFFSAVPFNEVINEHHFKMNHFDFANTSSIFIVALIAILMFIGMKVTEFFLIIYASLKTANGEEYKYPLTIPFIK